MFRSRLLRTLTSTSRRSCHFQAAYKVPKGWFSSESKLPEPEREEVTGGGMSLSEARKLTSTLRRIRHFPAKFTTSMRWFSAESKSPTTEREEVTGGGTSLSEAKELTSTSRRSLHFPAKYTAQTRWFSAESKSPAAEREEVTGDGMSLSEAKKLMRLVNVEALKEKLVEEGKEVICYDELLKSCESFGVARSIDEAKAFARVLDDAGVVLLFRDKVHLHPDKVVDLIKRSVPLALTPEDDPRREELKKLQERKEEIDKQAHKEVRVILWLGLGVTISLVGVFFRLTFWEFSWDVMEPIAFFTTTTGIIIGYTYFMFTAKDPSYQDLMQTMFFSRQRKLMKRYKFDLNRFWELREKCKTH